MYRARRSGGGRSGVSSIGAAGRIPVGGRSLRVFFFFKQDFIFCREVGISHQNAEAGAARGRAGPSGPSESSPPPRSRPPASESVVDVRLAPAGRAPWAWTRVPAQMLTVSHREFSPKAPLCSPFPLPTPTPTPGHCSSFYFSRMTQNWNRTLSPLLFKIMSTSAASRSPCF